VEIDIDEEEDVAEKEEPLVSEEKEQDEKIEV